MAIDLTKLRAFVKKLEALERDVIEVGVFGGQYGSENNNLNIAQVAYWQERGAINIPRRAFMARTLKDSNLHKAIAQGYKKAAQSIIKGYRHEGVLLALGERAANVMKRHLYNYGGRNASSTIQKKGFNHPLYETGTLLESIASRINRKGAL